LKAAQELKTKPTQHSVKELMQSGLSPDILVCRTEHHLNDGIRTKLALFCNVEKEAIIESIDAKTIYDVPNLMLEEGLDKVVLNKLELTAKKPPELTAWNEFLYKFKNPVDTVEIGLIGKYVELQDAYKSILESLDQAGAHNGVKVNIHPIHSAGLSKENVAKELEGLNGIIVAPGFGDRGIEGKIEAVRFVRENKIPFFGICLGMQMAVIEFARNVLHLENANSTEMDVNTPHPVIDLMEDQKIVTEKGGTMRLGAWDCKIDKDSNVYKAYQTELISERHRHRFEFNNLYLEQLSEAGLIATGVNPDTGLVEIIELPDHPWFVGVQYHPEYKSTVLSPHPLFASFIKAAYQNKKSNSINLVGSF
jgi:CTP synthase